jgi:periplasmic divalent cation tolerance protein
MFFTKPPQKKQDGPCVIQCSVGSETEAETIAKALLNQKLAACIQFIPITSWFVWEDRESREIEILLQIKTFDSRFADIQKVILSLHSYQVPEIIRMPITGITEGYFHWMKQQIASSSDTQQ